MANGFSWFLQTTIEAVLINVNILKQTSESFHWFLQNYIYWDGNAIQNVSGGKVSVLGGHNIGHSKKKKKKCTCVLFRTVSEIQLFHCGVV
jgi:hypothetical protein